MALCGAAARHVAGNAGRAGCVKLFSLLWCLMSLLLDVYHPKLKWKTETEAVKQSMNAMISMFGGMILIAVLVGAAVLLTPLGMAGFCGAGRGCQPCWRCWTRRCGWCCPAGHPLLIVYENIQNNKQNVTKNTCILSNFVI